jgi:hypothetical protein
MKNTNIRSQAKGRFVSIASKTKGLACGQILEESPSYLTYRDINTREQVKVAKKSITAVHCGREQLA